MVDYKITKVNKLLEVNNNMCHNYYYIVYGKMINEEKTRQRKFKFVVWHDIFDVLEWFDNEEKTKVTNEEIKMYKDELVWCTIARYTDGIRDFYDEKGLKEFYDMCNESINDFNRIAK